MRSAVQRDQFVVRQQHRGSSSNLGLESIPTASAGPAECGLRETLRNPADVENSLPWNAS